MWVCGVCLFVDISTGCFWLFVPDGFLVDRCFVDGLVCQVCFLLESLILAQDERWRRA